VAVGYGPTAFHRQRDAAVAAWGHLFARLWQSGPDPATNPEWASFVECTFPGYAPIDMGSWPTPSNTNFPDSTYTFPLVTWTAGTIVTAQVINGWALLDSSGELVYVASINPITINTSGQQVTLAAQGYFQAGPVR
jgi:hypothetical protein